MALRGIAQFVETLEIEPPWSLPLCKAVCVCVVCCVLCVVHTKYPFV